MSTPILNINSKTPLKVEAKNGDEDFAFWVHFPNFSFAMKQAKKAEFQELFQALNKAVKKSFDSVEELAVVDSNTYKVLGASLESPELLLPIKAWFLKNILALDGLDISVKEDTSDEVTSINYLKKDHEYFAPIFDQLWDKDYNVVGLIQRMNAYFSLNG